MVRSDNKMNDEDVKKLFEALKNPPFSSINSRRNIRVYPNFSPFCCLFSANDLTGYIEYDSKMLEFMDTPAIIWSLLHEEGHMRFLIEKIDWNNGPIEKGIIKTVEDNRQSEINADMYAAKQFFEKFPQWKAYEAMKTSFFASCYCNPQSFFCFLKTEVTPFPPNISLFR